jgi:hypothetical protein
MVGSPLGLPMAMGRGTPMRRRLLIFLVLLLSLSLSILEAVPATANTYPGLHEQEWTRQASTLNARITIEVNDLNQGRFRFHLRCFIFNDATRRQEPQRCDFYPGVAHWYDLTTGEHYSKTLSAVVNSADYCCWLGVYRTLRDGHTYAVKAEGFSAYFYEEGFFSNYHTICSYRVTWHSSGNPDIGSLYCYYA